ncbi:hypothetical protein GCM10025865_17110 [Paraoerskovia sediminicola]|uniref:Beta-xylanase n=1 Tax=Paraoerskovia sediminicola TaxID=1138587 RepID=A0ABN6XBR3_9CELL|nr:endo-1,4-beta-xylanase [Paraoerskovia sediminicola]BDZ42412.1 hypothetical protein GCM10025865_17110 [Paraoerskovia sediminicola]
MRQSWRATVAGLAVGALTLTGAAAGATIGAVAAAAADDTIIDNDFESTYEPWTARGDADLALTTTEAASGSSSLAVTGRTASWQGAATDVVSTFVAGETYTLDAQVKVPAGTAATTVAATVQESRDGTDDAYTQVASVAVDADGWATLTGTYVMPDALTGAVLYLEAATTGSGDSAAEPDFLVDDLGVTGTAGGTGQTEAVLATDFEDGLGGWSARGDGVVADTTTPGHDSGTAALVTNRTEEWHGLAHDVTSLIEPGSTYQVSAWVKLGPDEDGTADIGLSVQRTAADGGDSFDNVATAAGATADDWVQITGTYQPGPFESATLYVEMPYQSADLRPIVVDDVLVTTSSAGIETDVPDLKDALDVPFGVAIDGRETTGPSSELVLKHFDQITPENDMKPEEIQPTEGTFTFDDADVLMQFAKDDGLRVYGHVLVWHSQTADWMFEDPTTGEPLTTSDEDRQLLRDRMKTHIDTFAEHFAQYGAYGEDNPIRAIDVVNEVISEGEDDGLRRSEWYRILGPEYIRLAFEYAHEAFGDGVALFINDYNTEQPAKRAAYLDLVGDLLDEGVPVDGVGHQLHVSLLQPINQIEASIEAVDALADAKGVDLVQAVTELDVAANTGGESWTSLPQERAVSQGYYYRDLFDMLRSHAQDLFSVTVWGPTDARSWRSEGFPLLFDGALQAKPAFWGSSTRRSSPCSPGPPPPRPATWPSTGTRRPTPRGTSCPTYPSARPARAGSSGGRPTTSRRSSTSRTRRPTGPPTPSTSSGGTPRSPWHGTAASRVPVRPWCRTAGAGSTSSPTSRTRAWWTARPWMPTSVSPTGPPGPRCRGTTSATARRTASASVSSP